MRMSKPRFLFWDFHHHCFTNLICPSHLWVSYLIGKWLNLIMFIWFVRLLCCLCWFWQSLPATTPPKLWKWLRRPLLPTAPSIRFKRGAVQCVDGSGLQRYQRFIYEGQVLYEYKRCSRIHWLWSSQKRDCSCFSRDKYFQDIGGWRQDHHGPLFSLQRMHGALRLQ